MRCRQRGRWTVALIGERAWQVQGKERRPGKAGVERAMSSIVQESQAQRDHARSYWPRRGSLFFIARALTSMAFKQRNGIFEKMMLDAMWEPTQKC